MDGEPRQENHEQGESKDEKGVPGHPCPKFLNRKNHIRQGRNTRLIRHYTPAQKTDGRRTGNDRPMSINLVKRWVNEPLS